MTEYQKICDFRNLYNAHKKARCSKRHKADVIKFEMNLSENLCNIKKLLENRSYDVGGYKKFYVYEPKKREIQALSYYDRIVQHVLCDMVLVPIFDKHLVFDNCACRLEKGTLFGLNRLSLFLSEY